MRDFTSDGGRLLHSLGASKPAEEAYLNLLLKQKLDIPQSILNELVHLNLVTVGKAGPVAQPASPILQEALETKFAEVKNLKDSLNAFEAIESREPQNTHHVTVCFHEMNLWYNNIIHNAQSHIRYWDSDPHINREFIAPQFASVFKRGVFVESVYESESFDDPEFTDAILECVQAGEHASVAHKLPFRMLIADDREIMIMWRNEADLPIAMLSDYTHLISFLLRSFDHVRERSIPFGHHHTSGDAIVSDEAKEILNLMAMGLTDDAIARRLGVSTRTVGRRIGSLMTALNINTRFQLGIKAQQIFLGNQGK
ncbi:LuxR C-terminal-related transcriptional regulator [Arcanobacterium canis]